MSLSIQIRVLLLVTIAILINGCSTAKQITKEEEHYQPAVIDVDTFDPVDFFERAKNEMEARKQTKITKYYRVGHANIRFAQAVENAKNFEPPLIYDSITDIKGRTYFISKTTLLDGKDIELLSVEKSSYKGKDQYIIGLFFRKEAWDKVHNVTENLIKRNLAFIKDLSVISAPVVHEAVTASVNIGSDFNKEDIDRLIQGLIPTDWPSYDNWEASYTEWLERRFQKYPNESPTLLAWRYFEKRVTDCKKTIGVYEKIIQNDPSQSVDPFLQLLNKCYVETANYDKALRFYNTIVENKRLKPYEEVYIRMALSDVYDRNNDSQKALQELQAALGAANSLPLSYEWLDNSANKDEIKKQLLESKTQLIKLIETEIEKIKSQEIKRD